MEYKTVEQLCWNSDRTKINCIVDFVVIGKVQFSASLNDFSYSSEIYERCIAGEFGPIADYISASDEGPQAFSKLSQEMQIPV